MNRITHLACAGLLFWIASTVSSTAQVLLTGYGSTGLQPYTSVFTSGTVTVNSTNTTFTGSGVGLIARGTFASVDVSSVGAPPLQLQLDLSFASSYSGIIDIQIGSGPSNFWGYSSTVSALSGAQSLIFSRKLALDSGTVNPTGIDRVSITADNPNFTLDSLYAIPEPSTYLLLALGGLTLWGWRRLRVRGALNA